MGLPTAAFARYTKLKGKWPKKMQLIKIYSYTQTKVAKLKDWLSIIVGRIEHLNLLKLLALHCYQLSPGVLIIVNFNFKQIS